MAKRLRALEDSSSSTCAIMRTLSVVSDRWSFLILRDAFSGATRFAEFRTSLGIATDVLSDRLARLVAAGVLAKVPYAEPGQRTRDAYELTPAGHELKVVLGGLQQWGDDHLPRPEKPSIERVAHRTGRPLRVAFVDNRGRTVDQQDADFVRTETYPTTPTTPTTLTTR